jgi:hypothetical protein
VINNASSKLKLPNFAHSRDKPSGENFSRSAPGTQAKLADSRKAGAAPL